LRAGARVGAGGGGGGLRTAAGWPSPRGGPAFEASNRARWPVGTANELGATMASYGRKSLWYSNTPRQKAWRWGLTRHFQRLGDGPVLVDQRHPQRRAHQAPHVGGVKHGVGFLLQWGFREVLGGFGAFCAVAQRLWGADDPDCVSPRRLPAGRVWRPRGRPGKGQTEAGCRARTSGDGWYTGRHSTVTWL
jgi:hypothetical protein